MSFAFIVRTDLLMCDVAFFNWLEQMPFRSRPQVNSLIQDKDTLLHVCVTGGAGYIGSHFALKLLEDGHAVTIIDNLSRGNLGAIRQLQKIARPNQLQFYEMDIGLRDELVRCSEDTECRRSLTCCGYLTQILPHYVHFNSRDIVAAWVGGTVSTLEV